MKRERYSKSNFWNLLKSRKLAISLLLVILIFSALGTQIPQRSLLTAKDFSAWQARNPFLSRICEALGFTNLYWTWWYIALLVLLLINVAFCTASRFRQALRPTSLQSRSTESLRKFENFFSFYTSEKVSGTLQTIHSLLTARRYRVFHQEIPGGCFVWAEKGRFGVWGSLLFHFSFLIILVGVLVSLGTRVKGRMAITEGQTFTERARDYLVLKRGLLSTYKHSGFQVKLEEFRVETKGKATEYFSDVTVKEDGRTITQKTIGSNNPLVYKGLTFLPDIHGFSPLLVLKDKNGTSLLEAYIIFTTHFSKGKVKYEDFINVPGSDIVIEGKIYPDAIKNGQSLRSKSGIPRNPAIDLIVYEGEQRIFTGPAMLGQTVDFDGFSLTFADLRYWSSFWVIKDEGVPIIFVGCWLGIIGLFIVTTFISKRILVRIQKEGDSTAIYVAGRSRIANALFANEFLALAQQMEKTINNGGGGVRACS